MLIRNHWREHLGWIIFILAVSVLFGVLYLGQLSGHSWQDRPRASEGWLFIAGIAGGAICLFEFLLWPRKKYRTVRIGRVKTWMKAHIWLGLLAVPLLLIHSGFNFRNFEATLLFILFLIVIASGVWGLVMQQFLPQKMLEEVAAETIYSQIEHISNLMVDEADRMVVAVCGVSAADQAKPATAVVSAHEEEEILSAALAGNHFTVGAVRTIGGIQGKVLHSKSAYQLVEESEPLRDFFNQELADYLKRGKASGSRLAVANRARARFDELRLILKPETYDAVNALENMAEQRRQLDHQARLHFWLHNWLWVHLPLSVALMLLMAVHIFVTLKYQWPSR